jgi:hypothetical protein
MEATREWIARKVSVAVRPSIERSTISLSIRCLIPATRTSKNSSRLELTMLKNLTRSSKGLFESKASESTLWLNSSQLSSREIKWEAGWAFMALIMVSSGVLFSKVTFR